MFSYKYLNKKTPEGLFSTPRTEARWPSSTTTNSLSTKKHGLLLYFLLMAGWTLLRSIHSFSEGWQESYGRAGAGLGHE